MSVIVVLWCLSMSCNCLLCCTVITDYCDECAWQMQRRVQPSVKRKQYLPERSRGPHRSGTELRSVVAYGPYSVVVGPSNSLLIAMCITMQRPASRKSRLPTATVRGEMIEHSSNRRFWFVPVWLARCLSDMCQYKHAQARHHCKPVDAAMHRFIPHFHPNASELMLGVTGRMTVIWLVDNTMVRACPAEEVMLLPLLYAALQDACRAILSTCQQCCCSLTCLHMRCISV